MLSSKKKFIKRFLKGTAIAIIIYIAFSLVSTKLIYDSVFKRYDADIPESILSETAEMVKARKNFTYRCGEKDLCGHLYSDGTCEHGLILLVPGFRAESIEYEGVIYALMQEGFDVFAFNATGHGSSGGNTSKGFPQIIKDLEATLDYISGSKNFDYENIFLLGHSRGGYGACCVVNSRSNISAVVSVNGVDTSMDAIMALSTEYVGGIAYGNYPFLSLYESMIFGHELSSASAVREIEKSKIPVMIIQSSGDTQIPAGKFSIYSHREKITSENVDFLLYNKQGYNDHVSILYDKNRCANSDIIKEIANFYKEKSLQ